MAAKILWKGKNIFSRTFYALGPTKSIKIKSGNPALVVTGGVMRLWVRVPLFKSARFRNCALVLSKLIGFSIFFQPIRMLKTNRMQLQGEVFYAYRTGPGLLWSLSMDHRVFRFATRGQCIIAHCNLKQNMCFSLKQSSLFSFYALPSGGKSKGMVVHCLVS